MMFERDNVVNDDVMLNKLYNMIKTSLSINNSPNKRELLFNFERVAKDIDKREHKVYLEEVNDKFYKTTNLDDERKRLSSLIVSITERLEQRNKLLIDYSSVTGQSLLGLEEIAYANELNSFKERSNLICTYLENEDEIANIKKELEFLSNQLEKERDVKRNCEVVNAKLEEKLLNNFKNVIAGNKYYTSLSDKDIDEEIKKNEKEIKEKEEKVNAFVLAYESIKNDSITSNDQLEEYSSYVTQMKELYYDCSKKNTFLQIYKLVMNPKVTTEEIYHKRIQIKKLLDDLTAIKLKLKIEEPNLLFDFYMLVKEQDVKVINSVDNMKKIKQIEDKIDYFNDKIIKLEKEQENDRIIVILREYGLVPEEINNYEEINPYDNIMDNSNNEVISNEVEEPVVDNNDFMNNLSFELPDFNNLPIDNNNLEVVEEIKYLDNAIKEVKELSSSMNMVLISKKASNVINKVSSRLGIERKVIEKVEPITQQPTEVEPVINEQKVEEPIIDKQEENIINNDMVNNNPININNELVTNNINETNDIPVNNQVITDTFNQPNINMQNQEKTNEEQPVVMPNFDFTTFWDEITVNNDNNTDNGNNMPNLPI